MSASTIVTIIVVVFLVAAVVYGYSRGFLKILISTLALVVTLVLAFLLTPAVANLLDKTSLGIELNKQIVPHISVKFIAFLLIAILIFIVIRIILKIANVINKIPIIGGINRIFGAIVGLAEGLLVIWIASLIIKAIAFTPFGMQAINVINQSEFLKFLYDKNILAICASKVMQMF